MICSHDSRQRTVAGFGVAYPCPNCGKLVRSGQPHPDYDAVASAFTEAERYLLGRDDQVVREKERPRRRFGEGLGQQEKEGGDGRDLPYYPVTEHGALGM